MILRITSISGLFLSLFIACLFCSGCKKDDEGSLQLRFIASYGEEALIMDKQYDFEDGMKIKITKSDLYISELAILQGSNSNDLSEISFIDISESHLDEILAQKGFTMIFNNLTEGDYSGLQMGVGVSEAMNATVPADYQSSHPLSKTSHYWSPWTSFIFNKLEGRLDTLGNGIFDHNFVYHSGTDTLYQFIEIEQGFTISGGSTTEIIFTIDHRNILMNDGSFLDIKGKPISHSPEDLKFPQIIIENIASEIVSFQ